jgi:hypothetical protein
MGVVGVGGSHVPGRRVGGSSIRSWGRCIAGTLRREMKDERRDALEDWLWIAPRALLALPGTLLGLAVAVAWVLLYVAVVAGLLMVALTVG